MSKNFLSAIALVLALTMSAEAHAGLVIRFGNGTVLCLGSVTFCKEFTKAAQVSSYSDKLNVSVSGKQYSADSVTVSNVNGDVGLVTVAQSGRVFFSGSTSLSNTVVTDATNGQQNKLSDFGQFNSCP